MALDIQGAVYDFLLKYACREPDVPAYKPEQIIRGWQNLAHAPSAYSEICIITLLYSVRHGTNIYDFKRTDDTFGIRKVKEHVIQVDFLSAEPTTGPQNTSLRAEAVETAFNSYIGPAFFEGINPALTALYCDDIRNNAALDETQTYTARFTATLHLSELLDFSYPMQYFESLKIHTEDVDQHHKA